MTVNDKLGAAKVRPPADTYDVVVVGARVAGAATAMLLARCGHRVLVVDRGEQGADTVSTHTILRLGLLQLKRWGLLDRIESVGAPEIRTVTLGFDDEIVPIGLSADHGIGVLYAPRRTSLDPLLANAAIESGVEVAYRTRMVDLVWEGNRVCGIVVEDGDRQTEIRARYVVGADGVWSRTADRAGATMYRSFPRLNATYYAYYQDVETDGLWFQFTPGATAGLIPTNDGEVCVYVGWHKDEIGAFRSDPEAAFLAQAAAAHPALGEAVTSGTRVSPFRGTPGLPGFLRQPFGPGWVLVGDSGYTKDNISAHGISDAMRDAELSARALDASLTRPEREREYLSHFRVARDRLSVSLLEQSSRLGSYEWDASEASSLMRGLSKTVKDECAAMDNLPAWPGVLEREPATV